MGLFDGSTGNFSGVSANEGRNADDGALAGRAPPSATSARVMLVSEHIAVGGFKVQQFCALVSRDATSQLAPLVSRTRLRTASLRHHHLLERHVGAILTENIFQDYRLGFCDGHDTGQLEPGPLVLSYSSFMSLFLQFLRQLFQTWCHLGVLVVLLVFFVHLFRIGVQHHFHRSRD